MQPPQVLAHWRTTRAMQGMRESVQRPAWKTLMRTLVNVQLSVTCVNATCVSTFMVNTILANDSSSVPFVIQHTERNRISTFIYPLILAYGLTSVKCAISNLPNSVSLSRVIFEFLWITISLVDPPKLQLWRLSTTSSATSISACWSHLFVSTFRQHW